MPRTQKQLLKITHLAEYKTTHATDKPDPAAAFKTPRKESLLLEHTSLLGTHDGQRFKVLMRPRQENLSSNVQVNVRHASQQACFSQMAVLLLTLCSPAAVSHRQHFNSHVQARSCWPLVHVHDLFIHLFLYFVRARSLSLAVLDLDASTELARFCVMRLIIPRPWAQCQGLRELLPGAAHAHAYTLTRSNFT